MQVQQIKSTCVPLIRDNVDTDQIIPAKFLSITDKKGLGRNAFGAWRYKKDGTTPNPDFVFNQDTYKGGILVSGDNFGCGSSREHAVRALADYGFNAIIALGFSDIFYNNALNNFVVPVIADEAFHSALIDAVEADPETQVVIDVEQQVVSFAGHKTTFDLNSFKKHCLLTGQGNLEYLMSRMEKIEGYEERYGR